VSAPRVAPQVAKRKWYALAQRHRRMAERLLRSRFADGAVFHAYHAYECAISALIAANGVPVPTSHAGRFALFAGLRDVTKPYATTQLRLQRLTVQARNASLYYDEVNDALPTDRFNAAFAAAMLPLVHRFAREVWQEIR
jgi:HEPN domain-containing protein